MTNENKAARKKMPTFKNDQQPSIDNLLPIAVLNEQDLLNALPETISAVLTDLESEHTETNKTDQTNILDNDKFLSTIFGNPVNNAYPIVIGFAGNPLTVPRKKWFGYPWKGDSSDIIFVIEENNYFSLALFKPDDTGQYRRKKEHFQALYAVMLDDIGSKVEMERLTLPPSWLLETSQGNYQAGYLLDEPLINIKAADQLMKAIIKAGLCDPGANGPTARLARLPVAVNGKHESPFSCRMEIWSPDRRYSVQQLVDGFQLDIASTMRSKQEKSRVPTNCDADLDSVWIPCPAENTVIFVLEQRGLYKNPLGSGKHDITCPWKDEHTGGVDSGTAYFEPDDNWPVGGFKCLHGHCAERHIRDLLRMLNIEVSDARMKPIIRIIAGEIPCIVDAAEAELAQTEKYYQRGGLIVVVFNDPGTREIRIQGISQHGLVRALAGIINWERFDGRAKEWVRTDPPLRHVAVLYDSANYAHLPILNGLARQPYLRPDGSLMNTAGYDSDTRMFGVFNSSKFSIPDKPSRMQAEMALELLQELLAEFRFSNESDRAAALAAILTATIRPSLPLAPMFHARAHAVGSGKSYLCELITAFATPQRGTPTAFPADDEECRKLLLAEFMRSPPVIEFDNMTSDLIPHNSLCTALTSEHMSGRILGVSKTTSASTRVLFLSSGNNVGPVRDMARRCITISLNPEVEIPATRTFNCPNLINDVIQKREHYVSAALTIIRAWIIAERPMTDCKSWGNYGEWSDLCRQPLLWLGCEDPTLSIFEALSDDPDRETLARLLNAWKSVFGNSPAMVRDAVKKANQGNEDELKEILDDIAEERGEINRRRLGRWIKRHSGRIVNNLRFVRCDGKNSAEKWRVESVSLVLSVAHSTNEKTVSAADAYLRASSGE